MVISKSALGNLELVDSQKHFNPSGAETGILWKIDFNTKADDALAPYIANSSVTMVLNMQYKHLKSWQHKAPEHQHTQ